MSGDVDVDVLMNFYLADGKLHPEAVSEAGFMHVVHVLIMTEQLAIEKRRLAVLLTGYRLSWPSLQHLHRARASSNGRC